MSQENPFSAEEEKVIDEAFQHLIDSYLQTKHRKKVEKITKAFHFARQAHKGVRRHSGEPYILHPISVAQIVCTEIGLGSTSICSALLHDVVEDTDYTIDDIQNVFGPKIAQIVDGLTKISGGIFGDKASAQAENFKKLLLTMSDDIRVILIKIADRLHNMRTLQHMPERKQYKIAGETLYLYAPLAYRLGLNQIKTELEDLSFRYEHPTEYNDILDKLAQTKADRITIYEDFVKPINEKLQRLGVKYSIVGRVKDPYSIWKKMNSKQLSFEDVYDILAVRIIFEPTSPETELSECFNIYLTLTQIYKAHPDRLRDWLTQPKANGYQALHVTLMSGKGQWVEVQIRSKRMDEIAEQGIAAHWKYKAGSGDISEEDNESELNHWLETIKEILEDPHPDDMDFLDTIKLNLYSSEIFIFTPKGELRTMPQGSTVLDFAFTIHTFMGMHCIGAKVNHKLEAINYELKSGDQVEVLTSKSQKVSAEWLDFATTAMARGKINNQIRKENRANQKYGEAIFNDFLKAEELEADSAKIEKICRIHGLETREELMIALGQKKIILGDAEKGIIKGTNNSSWYSRFFKTKKKEEPESVQSPSEEKKNINVKKTLVITDQDLHNYKISKCCAPVPGDDVLGFVGEDGKVTIHKRNCSTADKLKSAVGNRIVTIEWRTEESVFPAQIFMNGLDSIGTLGKMTDIISQKMKVNISQLHITSNEGIFEGTLQVLVHNVQDIAIIIKELKKIPNIRTVVRKVESHSIRPE